MTREEAISEWTFRSNHIKKWLDEYGEEPSIRHYVELIDMAISALSADAVQIPIKLEKRYPESKDEDITDAFMRGYLAGRSSAEAVHGEWIRVGHDIYECSLCHQNVMTKDIDCYSYCHRCGARMKTESEVES